MSLDRWTDIGVRWVPSMELELFSLRQEGNPAGAATRMNLEDITCPSQNDRHCTRALR